MDESTQYYDTTPLCVECGERLRVAEDCYIVTWTRTVYDRELHSDPRGTPGLGIYHLDHLPKDVEDVLGPTAEVHRVPSTPAGIFGFIQAQ